MDIPRTMIHLLYVPTMFCNLGCRYCYLGDQTEQAAAFKQDCTRALATLKTAVDKMTAENVLPFHISLHGGEVTTLPADILEGLFQFIQGYYNEYRPVLETAGFKKDSPHIKTNLYNFDRLYDLFDQYGVSVSGSLDLPFSLHEKYRTTRTGGPSLDKILANVRQLGTYPHRKKISATLFKEHLARKKEIAANILELDEAYGFDMNRFNIMFGFESNLSRDHTGPSPALLKTATHGEQVDFYRFLKDRFSGIRLQKGLDSLWFEEFTPSFCTNSFNCGEKFFLLQSNGDVYSCVRGQGNPDFFYGNIFKLPFTEIIENGRKKISLAHKSQGFHEDCRNCGYIGICHTGCPFVKTQHQNGRSYTCLLQKELYAAAPERYPLPQTNKEKQNLVYEYAAAMHPAETAGLRQKLDTKNELVLPSDFHEGKNSLGNIIDNDPVLRQLYSDRVIYITVDEEPVALASQILKPVRQIHHIYPGQTVDIHINESLFKANCKEIVRNTLYIQMLRDTPVVYGEEKRTKQEHLFTHQVFYNHLEKDNEPGWRVFRAKDLLSLHAPLYLPGVLNNMFLTTGYLRDYHYTKQKNNGFYHVQALNLPFQNIEFYWR